MPAFIFLDPLVLAMMDEVGLGLWRGGGRGRGMRGGMGVGDTLEGQGSRHKWAACRGAGVRHTEEYW